ncbi:hypothetical protein C8Q74DRAFT_970351 [Fomes fomentarius]|nr:hypothetical protein C8Q74DRAFT_970351 [Fomes fomentarius]
MTHQTDETYRVLLDMETPNGSPPAAVYFQRYIYRLRTTHGLRRNPAMSVSRPSVANGGGRANIVII